MTVHGMSVRRFGLSWFGLIKITILLQNFKTSPYAEGDWNQLGLGRLTARTISSGVDSK